MESVATPRLEPAIRQALAPVLREDGFSGSGRRFRAEAGQWIKVVTVQGSRWGGSFAVNLGIHFATAPDMAGNAIDPKKMSEADCAFRRRLSETSHDRWWTHDEDATSMLAAVRSATETYVAFGRNYLSQAIEGLDAIAPKALFAGNYDLQGFGAGTKANLGLALARIRSLQGRYAESREFARFGIDHLGLSTFLKAELETLSSM